MNTVDNSTKLLSGLAHVFADADLTLLDVSAAFGSLLHLDQKNLCMGEALAPLLPPALLNFLQSTTQGCQSDELAFVDEHGKTHYVYITALKIKALPAHLPTSLASESLPLFQEDTLEKPDASTHDAALNQPAPPPNTLCILVTDLTALKDNWHQAEVEKQRYHLLTSVSDDVLFYYNLEADSITFSDALERVFGKNSVVAPFHSEILEVSENDIFAVFRNVLTMPHNVGETISKDCYVSTVSGRLCWFKVVFHFHGVSGAHPNSISGFIRDIDELKREQLSLLSQAQRDPMTGLLNKQTTEWEIRKALQSIGPNQLGVLFMLDIDNFKQVNDTMGHLAGDSVIQQVAQQLTSLFRKQDILGRVGGDEFLVFMSNIANTQLISEKAEILCSSIRRMFTNSNIGHEVSLSVGISFSDKPIEFEEIFSEADIALYHAKAKGKNRFEVFGKISENDTVKGSVPSPLAHNAVRNSIMIEIIDILFSMEDMYESIDKVLYFIGNALRVDKIFIAEKSMDLSTVSVTHEWARNEEWKDANLYQNIPAHFFFLPKADKKGIFYCTDTSLLSEKERRILEQNGVTSLLQSSITLNGAVVGHVAFEERGTQRIWSQQEVDTLVLMSKLLGEYIRRCRSSHLLDSTYETTRNLLNSLTTTVVYVVSRHDRRILYYNDTVRRMFPLVRLGMACHKAFWGQNEACAFCPACAVDTVSHVSCILYDTPFWAVTDVTLYPLLWENSEPAYAAILTEHINADTITPAPVSFTHKPLAVVPVAESSAQNLDEPLAADKASVIAAQYDRALRNIYDELFELNVTRNFYRTIYRLEGKFVVPPDEGTLDEGLKLVGATMIHPEDRERYSRFFDLEIVRESIRQKRECLIGEFRKLQKNGLWRWASLTLLPVEDSPNGDETYLVFVMDIETKKRAEAALQKNALLEQQRRADERYKTIVKQTGTLVFEWFPVENTRYIAPEIIESLAGNYDQRDIIRIWFDDDVIHPDDKDVFSQRLAELRAGQSYTEQTVRMARRDGTFCWTKVALTYLPGGSEHSPRIIGTLNDVDEATKSAQVLKYRAEFDTLTGIHNAQTFYSNATGLLAMPSERPYHVINLDVDRFKVINDLYGMEEGDKLLQAIATLIGDNFKDNSVYGRISGDIFCVCVDYTKDEIVERIKAIGKSLEHYPLPHRIAVSFGICRVDNRQTPITILCDWANLALKTVKGSFLKSYAFYDEKLREKILEEKKIESAMDEALLSGQFVMYLQPKVDIASSHIVGAEGLVRWQHPSEGLIQPFSFIPLFEKNGFITRLDEYIWEQACIALRRWLDGGYVPGPISVNVSRLHFHGTRLSSTLLKLVERYQIPPELLELEITETAFLENEREVGDIMRSLQAHGFRFSMDDFGSGYSSLTMLKTLPINIVKIDRAFLNESVSSDHGQIIIRHTISMVQQMNLRVIAEGVETLDQALFLLEAGCGYAQGYFYSKPVPQEEFENMAFSLEASLQPSPLAALNGAGKPQNSKGSDSAAKPD